jgi:hypothetical protein
LGAFVLYTRNEMQQLTGVKQFSPYGGWQLASNALYMYGHICEGTKEDLPAELYPLDSTVRRYFSSTHRVESLLEYDEDSPGYYYKANPHSPLLQYMNRRYGPDTIFQNFKKWGPMGVVCSEYGSYLIKNHPVAFFQYWIWPNSIRYFYPPTEIFTKYSPFFLRDDEFGKMAMQIFDVRTLTVAMPLINFRNSLLSLYSLFFTLLNILFVMTLIGFFLFDGIKKSNKDNLHVIYLMIAVWICNFAFSVTASPIFLRFQLFVMILQVAFSLLFLDFIFQPTDQVKSKYNLPKIG